MNDLIIKKISDDIYIFSINLGSTRWHFSIRNASTPSIFGVWVRVGSCGDCPIKIQNQQLLWKTVLDKLVGKYDEANSRNERR